MIRMSTTAATVNRVNAVIVVLACCCAGSTSAWAIDCLSNPGDPKTGYYSWRDIDGRKCWFKKTGAIPAKSQLQWPAKSKQEARSVEPASPSNERIENESAEPVAVAPPPASAKGESESGSPGQLLFRTARVRPASGPSLPLGGGVDLMNGDSLLAKTPASLAPADPFHARFTGQK